MAKDCWDKLEIVGKLAGAILVPIAAVCIANAWGNAKSARDAAVQMTTIAIGILSEGNEEGLNSPNKPLRDWAISVLQNPQSPPPVDATVAEALRNNGASLPSSLITGPFRFDRDAPRKLGEDMIPNNN